MSRAGEAFEQHRRELRAHCYRMLGSLADADDATQDAFLRAFRAIETLESVDNVRAWLYRIATNVCLDRLAGRAATPTEPMHVEPCPAAFWEPTEVGPDARIAMRESVALAFLSALQELPPLQRAVLLLRDVMGFSASEVAELLDQSVPSVNSALQRAREHFPARAPRSVHQTVQAELLGAYVRAFEARDATALATLLREDARVTMPPAPAVIGRDAIRTLLTGIFARHAEFRIRSIEISGGIGLAVWHRAIGSSTLEPHLVQIVEMDESGEIARLDTFLDRSLFARFGLPETIDR